MYFVGVVYVLSNRFVLTNRQRNICSNAASTSLALAKLVVEFFSSGIHVFHFHFFLKKYLYLFLCVHRVKM